jgi:hypothetical protein
LPDNTFSIDGQLTPEFKVAKIGYSSDNKLVALGSRNLELQGCCLGLVIMKYNTNGSNDVSFNNGNPVLFKYSSENDLPVTLIIEPENTITALFAPFNSDKQYGIAKFGPNGLPVTGWGINGILTGTGTDFPQNWEDGFKLNNGGFVFAGRDQFDFHILNILITEANGSPDNNFSSDGIGKISFAPALQFELAGILLRPGGKIIAGGNESPPSGGIFNEVSLNAVITQINTTATISQIYTMSKPGNWSDPANWQNNQIPPATITPGMEVIINPGGNGEALLDINIIVQFGGKIVIKPRKKLQVAANLTVPAITTE